MKKTVKIIIVTALIPVVAVVSVMIGLRYASLWKYNANYDVYSSDFETVRDFVLSLGAGEEEKVYYIPGPNENDYGYLADITTIEDPNEMIKLPEKVKKSLDVLDRFAFKESNLDVIRVTKNRVAFCIENGWYAFIWSPDQKPDRIRLTENSTKFNNAKFKVKSEGDGWYHVRATQ